MKRIVLILIASVAVTSTYSQLENTRWRTTINIDGPVNAIFDFKKDTVSLYTVADSTVIETMSYTSDANSFKVMKIEGQSDCDNNAPGKYSFKIEDDILFIKMLSDACEDRWTVIDSTRWTRWRNHTEIKVNESVLKQYVGVYEHDAAHPVTISFSNGKLYAEGPNNKLPKSPLVPESDTRFFLRIAGVEWDFVKDAKGKVIKLISHEEKDYELKKVK